MALSSPLLLRHPKTFEYIVNFNPYIFEVTREAEHVGKFQLDVPEFIKIVIFRKEDIFHSYNEVNRLVKLNNSLR